MPGYDTATKAQRRRLRELARTAHERELAAELEKVGSELERWRAGSIDAFELTDAIHRFHQGPARKLFTAYEPSNIDFSLAHAIHRGILTEAEVGPELLAVLAAHLSFLKAHSDG